MLTHLYGVRDASHIFEPKVETTLTAPEVGPVRCINHPWMCNLDAKKLSILAYEVPETGRYLLIVRRDFESDEDRGTYMLTAKVKQAKENKKRKGEWTGAEIVFDAVAGSTFKAKLAGE